MKRVLSANVSEKAGEKVLVKGWIQETRIFGGLKFIILKDRKGLMQITLPKKAVSEETFNLVDKLTKESVLYVTGEVKKSEKAQMGAEIIPEKIEVIAVAKAPTPIDTSGKIESDLSVRLDHRYLDVRNQKSRAIFEIRSKRVFGIFFQIISLRFPHFFNLIWHVNIIRRNEPGFIFYSVFFKIVGISIKKGLAQWSDSKNFHFSL